MRRPAFVIKNAPPRTTAWRRVSDVMSAGVVTGTPMRRSKGEMVRCCGLVAVLLASLLLTGCAGPTDVVARHKARVSVPDVVGSTLRRATCEITAKGLRWSQGRHLRASSRPVSACGVHGIHSSLDDLRVIGQSPAAKTRARPHSIVIVRDGCSASRPCS